MPSQKKGSTTPNATAAIAARGSATFELGRKDMRWKGEYRKAEVGSAPASAAAARILLYFQHALPACDCAHRFFFDHLLTSQRPQPSSTPTMEGGSSQRASAPL